MPTQPAKNGINTWGQSMKFSLILPTTPVFCLQKLFFWNSRSTMCLIRILSLYAVLAVGLGEKDYTFESGRQVNFGIGFRE